MAPIFPLVMKKQMVKFNNVFVVKYPDNKFVVRFKRLFKSLYNTDNVRP